MNRFENLTRVDYSDPDHNMSLHAVLAILLHRLGGEASVTLEEMERVEDMDLALFFSVKPNESLTAYALPQVGLKS